MTLPIRAAALVAALMLSACTTLQPSAPVPGGESLSGRLAVNVAATPDSSARALTATFELSGDARNGQLNLSTPLGSMLAQARWSPDRVVLATPQGERRFADLDELTREVVGESLPVPALFDWLRGRPWPAAASRETTPPAPRGFEQLGWTIDLARFDESWVAATRPKAPAVSVRARLDRP